MASEIRIQRTFPFGDWPGFDLAPDLALEVAPSAPPPLLPARPKARSVATLRPDKHEIVRPRFETFPGKFASRRGRRTRRASRASRLCAVVRDCIGQNRYPGGSAPLKRP